ncbi:uncharacterized protein L203_105782 [Cryptococcus depauperatus CBS 7841]|uniref:Protein mms22 n=1 Tax=Cryptococcus depauperatus CBS 7841 TaxID=1295531 RepID=A0AAJ8JY15_9TREE
MPPRSRPRASVGSTRKTRGLPFTQTGPSTPASLRSDSEDPLLLTAHHVTDRKLSSYEKRSSQVLSSSPSRGSARLTRAGKKKDRDDEELGEIVPPSDNDEYEDWKESYSVGISREERSSVAASSPLAHITTAKKLLLGWPKEISVQPKSPDKRASNPVNSLTPIHQRTKVYINLFSPNPPLSIADSRVSPSSTNSGIMDTTPQAKHLATDYSQSTTSSRRYSDRAEETPAPPTRSKVKGHKDLHNEHRPLTEEWDSEEDEIDFLRPNATKQMKSKSEIAARPIVLPASSNSGAKEDHFKNGNSNENEIMGNASQYHAQSDLQIYNDQLALKHKLEQEKCRSVELEKHVAPLYELHRTVAVYQLSVTEAASLRTNNLDTATAITPSNMAINRPVQEANFIESAKPDRKKKDVTQVDKTKHSSTPTTCEYLQELPSERQQDNILHRSHETFTLSTEDKQGLQSKQESVASLPKKDMPGLSPLSMRDFQLSRLTTAHSSASPLNVSQPRDRQSPATPLHQSMRSPQRDEQLSASPLSSLPHSEDGLPSHPVTHQTQNSSPPADLSAVFAAVAAHPSSQKSTPLPVPQPEIDLALLQFRTGRTFRTRTIVQLQPYTKERQFYEAQLRKGRIDPHARTREHEKVRQRQQEMKKREKDKDDAMVSQSSEADVSESSEAEGASNNNRGERIVIGPSVSPSRHRARNPVFLIDADYDEYFILHGYAPAPETERDAETENELRRIAKVRIRKEKAEQRQKRKDERRKMILDKESRRQKREKQKADQVRTGEETRKRQKERLALKQATVSGGAIDKIGKARSQRSTDSGRRQDEGMGPQGRCSEEDQNLWQFLENLKDEDLGENQSLGKPKKVAKSLFKSKERNTYSNKHRHKQFSYQNPNITAPFPSDLASQSFRKTQTPHTAPHKPHEQSLSSYHPASPGPEEMQLSYQSALSQAQDIGYAQPLHSLELDEQRGEYNLPPIPLTPSPQVEQEMLRIDDILPSPVFRSHQTILHSGKQLCSSAPSIEDLSGSDSLPSSSTSFDDLESSKDMIRRDPRRKIAGRMMPAAMLRRLEAEAARKEKEKVDRKRREQRERAEPGKTITNSPRPGRAVVRQAELGELRDIQDLFSEDDSEVEIGMRTMDENERDKARSVVFVDDESSEAIEDNYAEQTFDRLQRGDFEGIVAGKGSRNLSTRVKQGKKDRRHAGVTRRPTLCLVGKRRGKGGSSEAKQTRLNFKPIEYKSNNLSSNKKRKRPTSSLFRNQRPAIRLDDHIIFAPDDFDFDSTNEGEASPSQMRESRKFKKTISSDALAASRFVQPESLDAGIGKARSWANFDRFPVDFDIKPLPSGLYCRVDSVPGSGKLNNLVNFLQQFDSAQVVVPAMINEHGVSLANTMSPLEIQEILSIVFDTTYRQLMAVANDYSETSESPVFASFEFLGLYLSAHGDNHGIEGLKIKVGEAIENMAIKIDAVDFNQLESNKKARNSLLMLRWVLFELSCRVRASKAKNQIDSTLVAHCAYTLIKQLLLSGFDRTIAPLKSILRGKSDSPEIQDVTITLWISILHSTAAWDLLSGQPENTTFLTGFNRAIDAVFHLDMTGPIAAERIWFLVFGLCALSQFDDRGEIGPIFNSVPRWTLVRRAVSFIKVVFDENAEKRAKMGTLRGRDRYIKTMMARCVKLSSVWKWYFNRESFSVATRDLGIIFKDRQYRNFPSEAPVDYPQFIIHYNMALTAAEDTKHETAFELYLRLVCVAASDIISSADTLVEAQQAEKDVQRLVMSIIPVSAVKFNRLFPPSPRQLGQLINRYSTMIAACYFSPSLLSYLLVNSKKWSVFQQADFDSRQICIRGLMYVAVACRHHNQPLEPVVKRLAEILGLLQTELELRERGQAAQQSTSKLEIERTMVLVVTCFRQMIIHHSFDTVHSDKLVYPDPCLLHESWTNRIFNIELTKDLECAFEVIATIQTYLDARACVLPGVAKRRREAKGSYQTDSLDEYGSLGIDFTTTEVLALGGEEVLVDPTEELDRSFIKIIENIISPRIYRLLSDMLSPMSEDDLSKRTHEEKRSSFISRLTKCWSDMAAVLVVEHQKLDWSTFISPFGRQSWARLGEGKRRIQVGLHFMLNVVQIDPASFNEYSEDFVALLFQSIGTDTPTIEHSYLSVLVHLPHAVEHPLLTCICNIEAVVNGLNRATFIEIRPAILQATFSNASDLLFSRQTSASTKSFIYRCINLFVSSLISFHKSINQERVLHKQSYDSFLNTTINDLRRLAGEFITPVSVPGLKYFEIL